LTLDIPIIDTYGFLSKNICFAYKKQNMERDKGPSSRLAALFKPGAPSRLYDFTTSVIDARNCEILRQY